MKPRISIRSFFFWLLGNNMKDKETNRQKFFSIMGIEKMGEHHPLLHGVDVDIIEDSRT